MKFQNERYQDTSDTSVFKKLTWVFGILFFVAFVAAIYYGSRTTHLANDKSNLALNLEDLDQQKMKLENDLTVLDSNYQVQISTNDTLSSTLQDRLKEVDKLKARVWSAKQNLAKSEEENQAINDKLAQLETLKADLESDIASLNETNEELIATNEEISADLEMSKKQTDDLNTKLTVMTEENQKLVSRLRTLAPAGFIANNFTVTAAKKNDKLTAKANRAETINISFDINDVPQEFQDEEEIYLVLTKSDGQPIQALPTKEVEVASVDPVNIKVVDRTKTTLKDRQNIEMSFDADRDLESGLYNVLVYADHGFLGSTTFQLR
ncbi:MAG: hypothetical protein KDC80_10540 [Saprospiraceae bacterium]|nr:hypothetical protein [Saprospiraceae bacterium]